MIRYLIVFLVFLISTKGFSSRIDFDNSEVMATMKNTEEKPIVILITSYNNERFARDNMISVLNQEYSNYRVIFVNDCSTDSTLEIVQSVVKEFHAEDKVIIINNTVRKLGLGNYYEVIVNHTKDEEIVTCVDGDDFLANSKVLLILNTVYSNPQKEVWLTYGQFMCFSNRSWGWNQYMPDHIMHNNNFRGFTHVATHLRTFYSWLFKRINVDDLKYKGNFFEMAWDLSFMFPMLEMSKGRYEFIENFLYLYNDTNPINDHKVNVGLQRFYDGYIRALPKYRPLRHSIFSSCTEESCIICNKNISDQIYQ